LTQVQNFTSWAQKGKRGTVRCQVKWHLKIVVQEGILVSMEWGTGHISTDF
jgi:hypothetical protein